MSTLSSGDAVRDAAMKASRSCWCRGLAVSNSSRPAWPSAAPAGSWPSRRRGGAVPRSCPSRRASAPGRPGRCAARAFSTSTCRSIRRRYSASVRSLYIMCRPSPRSGLSSCRIKSGGHDGLVLRPHRLGQRLQVGVVVGVVVVRLEQGDHTRRGGVHEARRLPVRGPRGRETAQVVLERGQGRGPDLADAARPSVGRRAAAAGLPLAESSGSPPGRAGGRRGESPSKPVIRSLM